MQESLAADVFSDHRYMKLKELNRLFVSRAKSAGTTVADVLSSIPEIESARCEKTNGLRYALRSDLEGMNLMQRATAFGNDESARAYGKYFQYIDLVKSPEEFRALKDWLSCLEGVVEVSTDGAKKWLEERRAEQ
jgi:hypothetical protein